MLRVFLITVFTGIFFCNADAQEISSSDRIQEKVILYLPTATKAQLDNLADEFTKHKQIKKAVYVPGEHKCLLIDVKPDNEIIFYSDIMKIVCSQIPLKDMVLKTPSAYNEIYGKGDNGAFTTLK